ncbi:sensor domain-containing protein [Mycobacteroides abscessus]|uniref:sensor domain-containing protein n=1 Tax=Mycobacteroides abscessus TaxID=36809 RepID=UPI0012FFDFC2|nr:sensor domain-containing protein [Mycobacteroides abscessus]
MTVPPHGPTSGAPGGEDPTQVGRPGPVGPSYPSPPPYSAPPQWPAPGQQQQPPYGWQQETAAPAPQPQQSRSALRRWAIPAAAVVVVVGAAAAVAVKYSSDSSKNEPPTAATPAPVQVSTTTTGRSTTTSTIEASAPPTPSAPPPPIVVAESALKALLLSPADINTIMGTKNLVVPPNGTYSRALRLGTFTPPECANASAPGEDSTYSLFKGGVRGIAVQAIREPASHSSHNVLEVVANFADDAAARTFFDQQVANWGSCSGKVVTNRDDSGTSEKTRVGPGSVKEDIHYLTLTNPDPADTTGMVCQRAITTVANVVIDTRACAADITTQAIDMARQIRQGVH